ncbi:28030_t:CDS:1, partial [Dentiscutata erythropus]
PSIVQRIEDIIYQTDIDKREIFYSNPTIHQIMDGVIKVVARLEHITYQCLTVMYQARVNKDHHISLQKIQPQQQESPSKQE